MSANPHPLPAAHCFSGTTRALRPPVFRRLTQLAIAIVVLLAAARATATVEKTNLAADLGYLRVHSYADAAATIQSELAAPRALVLDLRYATAGNADAKELTSELAARPAAQPTFVLVSPETPDALAVALQNLPTGVVTIGVRDSNPQPAVVVAQEAAVDRRAFDAADSGMPIPELISGRIEKDRFDEAALVREFRKEPIPDAPKSEAKKDGQEKVPLLVDRVLQRAVHIHRALRAIKPRG